jgi:uncharacterized protein involved in outer membrane biogenesis
MDFNLIIVIGLVVIVASLVAWDMYKDKDK